MDSNLQKGKIHALDSEEHVEKRANKLVELGFVSLLVKLARDLKHVSEGTKENLANVFLSFATYKGNRGALVRDGALKLLVSLATENTAQGLTYAAQAMAKITISTPPDLAFRNCSELTLVPILYRLSRSDHPLLQFEALLALTNIASISEESKTKIIKSGLSWLESLQLSDEPLVRRAACELFCNLIQSEELYTEYQDLAKSGSKIKLWKFLCNSEDLETVRASAAVLAMLSQEDEICRFLGEEEDCSIYVSLLCDDDAGIQHRGLALMSNLLNKKPFAEKIIHHENYVAILLTLLTNSPKGSPVHNLANECLNKLQGHKLPLPINIPNQ
eukprot:TRINITY_DN4933_c0_g1_i5.p1 TRINITY_DN4933_c0_g1~~TRINITY_DN4933_c0_g1_i5.p1  ORF type:complete len:362 (+),score=95.87 TRINITY_DN4933_c0_g1_i5:95-1087(+)